ncbi:MAG: hypothetical protein KGY61_08610 [Desulfobacterales bacterium]|nr:hypothetical protein [Desulfobacterales bacterium]
MIKPEMTVLDIISQHRETEAVFKSYDALAGECICCNSLFNTLEQVADKYQFDIHDMMQALENALQSSPN